VRVAFDQVAGEAHHVQKLADPAGPRSAREEAVDVERFAHQIADRHARIERRV
jgi:hypothetical protein